MSFKSFSFYIILNETNFFLDFSSFNLEKSTKIFQFYKSALSFELISIELMSIFFAFWTVFGRLPEGMSALKHLF